MNPDSTLRQWRLVWRCVLLMVAAVGVAWGQEVSDVSNDPVALLWKRINSGQTVLDTTSDRSFLLSLLKELDVPVASQVLVFSKTSLQKSHIDPRMPRAIYYNEECYIGWVQGGDLELVAADQGGDFQYYVVSYPFVKDTAPTLVKSNQCLSCHVGGSLQIQSMYTQASGYPMGKEDRFVTTYESPLSDRWGGWYVTGKHGRELHMGNVTAVPAAGGATLDRQRGANVQSLEKWFPLEPYPISSSDIVALMVLEHQYVMHNTLMESAQVVRRLLKRVKTSDSKDARASLQRILHLRAREITNVLLYTGEYPLQDGGVTGSTLFQETFRRNRLRSTKGHSLKDFDLRTRMFNNRCSYMIHSASFRGMPEVLRRAVYELLEDVLSDRHEIEGYGHLEAAERERIRQILLETEPDAREFMGVKG